MVVAVFKGFVPVATFWRTYRKRSCRWRQRIFKEKHLVTLEEGLLLSPTGDAVKTKLGLVEHCA